MINFADLNRDRLFQASAGSGATAESEPSIGFRSSCLIRRSCINRSSCLYRTLCTILEHYLNKITSFENIFWPNIEFCQKNVPKVTQYPLTGAPVQAGASVLLVTTES